MSCLGSIHCTSYIFGYLFAVSVIISKLQWLEAVCRVRHTQAEAKSMGREYRARYSHLAVHKLLGHDRSREPVP